MGVFKNFRNYKNILHADGFAFLNSRKLGMRVINKTGTTIQEDKLVAISGYDTTSKRPKIVLADADVAGHTDVWVTKADIADGKTGFVFKGFMSEADLDTNSATAAGDPVYLSTTAGSFAHTAPTGTNSRQQIVGYVVVKSATVGQIEWDVQNPVRTGTSEINGLGFTQSGDGGTVTQATSKSTGVTLSTKTGQITMNAAALAADTTVSFVLTNTLIAANDVLILNHISGGTPGSYLLNARSAAGSATIDVRNITAGSLSEAIVISFVLVKAVTA